MSDEEREHGKRLGAMYAPRIAAVCDALVAAMPTQVMTVPEPFPGINEGRLPGPFLSNEVRAALIYAATQIVCTASPNPGAAPMDELVADADILVKDMPISTRVKSALMNGGYLTELELSRATMSDLLDIRGIGLSGVDDVRRAMARRGLSLVGE